MQSSLWPAQSFNFAKKAGKLQSWPSFAVPAAVREAVSLNGIIPHTIESAKHTRQACTPGQATVFKQLTKE